MQYYKNNNNSNQQYDSRFKTKKSNINNKIDKNRILEKQTIDNFAVNQFKEHSDLYYDNQQEEIVNDKEKQSKLPSEQPQNK